ncbi:MAG: cytochrome c biogenesis protein CcsA, partial [Chlamydiia bacterium]|nr:cytochrome c biogenesis protein CcsA [Chlamydiia bacterium]
KPINTLSSEILRKVTRSNSYKGLDASQVILDMMLNPENWGNAPLIKVSSKKLKGILSTEDDKVSFNHITNIISKNGENIIHKYAVDANNKPASDRDSFDKDVLKVNERVNISYMILTSEIFKIFPDDACETCEWKSIRNILEGDDNEARQILMALVADNKQSDWVSIDINISNLYNYQLKYSNVELPSQLRVKSELLYNKLNLFPKLAIAYFVLGLILLVLSFVSVLRTDDKFNLANNILKTLLYLTFGVHVFAFVIRWYIAGYAPLSNGYETILFIAIITMLTGIVLSKKSQITYAVSAILSSILLLVASLSYFDPEITNQAPVLKSIWLIIHVAIITMSYGFFGISALLGLFNLFIYIFLNKNNHKTLNRTLNELSDIIEITIIIGLYLLTIGTFLGAIWANESWGRYWGWDPKETWALVTVLVYATFVHLRFTKYLKGSFAISISAVLMISSVLMTYFGVNYFLSGLHSYAGDGPSIVPTWVYYTALGVVLLSLFAYLKKKRLNIV